VERGNVRVERNRGGDDPPLALGSHGAIREPTLAGNSKGAWAEIGSSTRYKASIR
jgi:hypothetical protein